jgi:hypothetical protein
MFFHAAQKKLVLICEKIKTAIPVPMLFEVCTLDLLTYV